MDNNKKNIVFIADNNYAQHTAVAISSLIINNRNEKFCIWVLSTSFDSSNRQIYKELSCKLDFELHIVNFDVSLIDDYDNIGPWSKYTFMKLYIGYYLPQYIKTVLYLDSDLIVVGNISDLFDLDLNDNAVAGVSDVISCIEHKKRCSLPQSALYINSGVMMLNLDFWRKELDNHSFEKFILKHKNKISICDQDVINSIFFGNILDLHLKYNVTTHCFGINPYSQLLPSKRCQLKEARKYPIIIHFVNNGKPWFKEYYHQYKTKYFFYLKQTPYRNFRPKYINGNFFDKVNLYFRGMIIKLIDIFRF